MSDRAIEALTALDPDGIRLARGVHFLAVTVVSGGVCYFVAIWLGAPEVQLFALLGGAVALNAFIFTPAGTQRSEAIAVAPNIAIALIVFGLGVLVGWREMGLWRGAGG